MSDAWWQKSHTEIFIQVAWHLGSECSLTEAWILCWLWRMSRRDSTKRCVPWMVSKTMTFLVPQLQAVKDTFSNWNRAVNFFEHVRPGTGQLSEKKEKTTWMLGDLICNHELLLGYNPKTNVKPENDHFQNRNLFFYFQVLVFWPERAMAVFFLPYWCYDRRVLTPQTVDLNFSEVTQVSSWGDVVWIY